MSEKPIVFETEHHWVSCNSRGHYEVWRKKLTHSERCGYIGFSGEDGLAKAKREVERRESK